LREDETAHEIQIKVLDDVAVNEETIFKARFEDERNSERGTIEANYKTMASLIELQENATACLANIFTEYYYPVAEACGGCAHCRKTSRAPYVSPPKTRIIGKTIATVQAEYLSAEWKKRTLSDAKLHIWLQQQLSTEDLQKVIVKLLAWGHQQFIVPVDVIQNQLLDDSNFLKQCAKHAYIPHEFMDYAALRKQYLYPIPTMILYPDDAKEADGIFRAWKVFSQQFETSIAVTHVYHRELYLKSEQGLFRDRIDGYKQYLAGFFDWTDTEEEFIL
jgi:hypothetical protein